MESDQRLSTCFEPLLVESNLNKGFPKLKPQFRKRFDLCALRTRLERLSPVRSTDGGTPLRPGIYSWESYFRGDRYCNKIN